MKLGIVTVPYIINKSHLLLAEETYESIDKVLMNITGLETFKIAVYTSLEYSNSIKTIAAYNDKVVSAPENCLGAAWNIGVKQAIQEGCDVIYIPNLDIEITSTAFAEILDYIKANNQHGIYAMSAINSYVQFAVYPSPAQQADAGQVVDIVNHDQSFSSFFITKEAYETIGEFTEVFKPAYYEDCDYLYRAKKAGYTPKRLKSAIFFHHLSGTRKGSAKDQEAFNTYFKQSTELYIKIHGGLPNQETK